MRAVCWYGKKDVRVENVPDPKILNPRDAIVRVTAVPSLLVVRPDGIEGLSRLHEAGAWFVIDPQAIAACFTNTAAIY